MLHAAIVEDDLEIQNYIRKTLIHSFQEKSLSVEFDIFSSGNAFLSMFEDHYHYDMIFLDIEMPEIDGITVCKRIRQIAPDSLVVFISNKEELVFQTFEVQPFRFIRKSQYDALLPSLIDSLIQKITYNNRKMIRIVEPVSHDIFSFDISQIIYIEAQRKDCRIVTTDGETIIRCKLMYLEETLSEYHFLKPHRSYLVNCKYLFYIGKTNLKLTTKEELPISRGKLPEVKQAFLSYSMNE